MDSLKDRVATHIKNPTYDRIHRRERHAEFRERMALARAKKLSPDTFYYPFSGYCGIKDCDHCACDHLE